MPGPYARLSRLQLSKRLLLAESELQRAAMIQDLAAVETGLRLLAAGATAAAALAATAGMAQAACRSRRALPIRSAGLAAALRTALRGFSLLLPVWRRWRSQPSAAASRTVAS